MIAGALAGFFDARTEEELVLQKRACYVSGVEALIQTFPQGSSQVLSPETIQQLGLSEGLLPMNNAIAILYCFNVTILFNIRRISSTVCVVSSSTELGR
jgi:hypothetical protein